MLYDVATGHQGRTRPDSTSIGRTAPDADGTRVLFTAGRRTYTEASRTT